MTAKLKEVRAQLRKRMHARVPGTVEWLQQVVRGYFRYHAVPGNCARLQTFRNEVLRSWLKTLRRRSQRQRMSWERFNASLEPLIPPVQVLHPYPSARFDAKHSHPR
jgi:RNA-directed DNA polymerase